MAAIKKKSTAELVCEGKSKMFSRQFKGLPLISTEAHPGLIKQ